MKTIFLILMQVLLFSAVTSAQTTKVVYTCPMHPEVQQAKPGNCPKCGMNLEKKTIKVAAPKTTPKKASHKTGCLKTNKHRKEANDSQHKASTGNDDVKGMLQELKSDVAEIKEMVTGIKRHRYNSRHRRN